MKKMFAVLVTLMLCLFSASYAETAYVTTPEAFTAAMNDAAVDAIEITDDMTITDSYVMQTKDVTILSDVVFQPAPDDGFFVKSWEVPEGITLIVKGKVATVHTFDTGFVIAQFYLNGGAMDISEGAVSDDCNICFNAGTLTPPAEGFAPDVEVTRYLYENVTEQAIMDALAVESLKNVTVQAECTIDGSITVPEDKELQISSMLTISNGASVDGTMIFDAGCGAILMGSGRVNDITVPDGMAACIAVWTEDGNYTMVEYNETPVAVTVGDWLSAQGMCGNCTLTVTVKEIINPALALVEDETGEVNLYGIQIDQSSLSIEEAGIQPGDVLTLSNPKYNVYDGNVEMSDAILVK